MFAFMSYTCITLVSASSAVGAFFMATRAGGWGGVLREIPQTSPQGTAAASNNDFSLFVSPWVPVHVLTPTCRHFDFAYKASC